METELGNNGTHILVIVVAAQLNKVKLHQCVELDTCINEKVAHKVNSFFAIEPASSISQLLLTAEVLLSVLQRDGGAAGDGKDADARHGGPRSCRR